MLFPIGMFKLPFKLLGQPSVIIIKKSEKASSRHPRPRVAGSAYALILFVPDDTQALVSNIGKAFGNRNL